MFERLSEVPRGSEGLEVLARPQKAPKKAFIWFRRLSEAAAVGFEPETVWIGDDRGSARLWMPWSRSHLASVRETFRGSQRLPEAIRGSRKAPKKLPKCFRGFPRLSNAATVGCEPETLRIGDDRGSARLRKPWSRSHLASVRETFRGSQKLLEALIRLP